MRAFSAGRWPCSCCFLLLTQHSYAIEQPEGGTIANILSVPLQRLASSVQIWDVSIPTHGLRPCSLPLRGHHVRSTFRPYVLYYTIVLTFKTCSRTSASSQDCSKMCCASWQMFSVMKSRSELSQSVVVLTWLWSSTMHHRGRPQRLQSRFSKTTDPAIVDWHSV